MMTLCKGDDVMGML